MRKLAVFGFTTMDGADCLESIKPRTGGHDIITIRGQDLAAIAAWRKPQSFLKSRVERALARLHCYQSVLETVMPVVPVLPAKFDTVLPGQTKVESLLKTYADEIKAPLQEFGRLIQYEILAVWTVSAAVTRLRQEGVVGLKFGEGAVITPQIKSQIDTALQDYKRQLTERFKDLLDGIVLDSILTERTEDEVVFNMTVLLRPSDEVTFDNALTEFDTKTGGSLTIKCTGPLPPCNFAAVEITGADLGAVETARRRLNLQPSASWTEIRNAYHTAMKSLHPDLNGAQPNVSHRMNELQEAYALLNRIAAGQAGMTFNPVRQPRTVVRFDARTLEQTYTVRLRRSDDKTAFAA